MPLDYFTKEDLSPASCVFVSVDDANFVMVCENRGSLLVIYMTKYDDV